LGRKWFAECTFWPKADPGNAGWQPDFSLSQERIGDVLCAQGNLAELAADFVLMPPRRKVLGKDDRPEAPIPAERVKRGKKSAIDNFCVMSFTTSFGRQHRANGF
jgi:hypothetical protein